MTMTTLTLMLMTTDFEQSIIGWEGKDIVANSSEIVYEGKLKVEADQNHDDQNMNILIPGWNGQEEVEGAICRSLRRTPYCLQSQPGGQLFITVLLIVVILLIVVAILLIVVVMMMVLRYDDRAKARRQDHLVRVTLLSANSSIETATSSGLTIIMMIEVIILIFVMIIMNALHCNFVNVIIIGIFSSSSITSTITITILIIISIISLSISIMIGRLTNMSDREDEEGIRWSFELCPRDQPRLILKVRIPTMSRTMMPTMQADNGEEKQAWMAALVMLTTKSMLERYLDVILR